MPDTAALREQIERADGFLYKLADLRGRIKGRDETLIRLLTEALDAARDPHPFLPCTIERLENALRVLTKALS